MKAYVKDFWITGTVMATVWAIIAIAGVSLFTLALGNQDPFIAKRFQEGNRGVL